MRTRGGACAAEGPLSWTTGPRLQLWHAYWSCLRVVDGTDVRTGKMIEIKCFWNYLTMFFWLSNTIENFCSSYFFEKYFSLRATLPWSMLQINVFVYSRSKIHRFSEKAWSGPLFEKRTPGKWFLAMIYIFDFRFYFSKNNISKYCFENIFIILFFVFKYISE